MNIKGQKACLIIPVENQVRELDPKLLLACIAVKRGFAVIIGSHRKVDFRITSFPRGLYLNKSMTERNLKMFYIMEKMGHEILTWDEEALVRYQANGLRIQAPGKICFRRQVHQGLFIPGHYFMIELSGQTEKYQAATCHTFGEINTPGIRIDSKLQFAP